MSEDLDDVRRRSALWAGVCALCMVVLYSVAPVHGGQTWVVTALVAVVVVVVAVPFVVIRRRLATSARPLADAVMSVVLMLVTLILGFSSIYLAMAHDDPTSIPGLDSKVDSVYFTVTTLATVGYGDIHPVSQPARAVTTLQMLLDLTVVAVAARLVLSVAQQRRQAES